MEGTTLKCYCKSCIESRIIDAAVKLRNVDILVLVIRRLQNENCHIGMDLGVMKAIMDGTWPSAQSQLYRALGRTIDRIEHAA